MMTFAKPKKLMNMNNPGASFMSFAMYDAREWSNQPSSAGSGFDRAGNQVIIVPNEKRNKTAPLRVIEKLDLLGGFLSP